MSDDETVPTRFVLEVNVDVSFDADDIVKDLRLNQLVALIKEIDEEVGQWEFSELLARHFIGQQILAAQHAPMIQTLSDSELIAELNSLDVEGDK